MKYDTEKSAVLRRVGAAVTRALQNPRLALVASPTWTEDGEVVCRFDASLEEQIASGFPPVVPLRVMIPPTFPLGSIRVYPEHGAALGHPHQDGATGKLCLRPHDEAAADTSRLLVMLEHALGWLDDAAGGRLLREGEPFELPDFSSDRTSPPSGSKVILFDEPIDGVTHWGELIGSSGTVDLVDAQAANAWVVRRFVAQDERVVSETTLPDSWLKGASFRGRWVLLPRLLMPPHRPPRTFGELRQAFQTFGIALCLHDELHAAWQEEAPAAVLLVGFPIPKVVGAEPSEVHWQPVVFSGRGAAKAEELKKPRSSGRARGRGLWNVVVNSGAFAGHAAVPWGRSRNIASGRLLARGGVPDTARGLRTTQVGCGAIGCVVAELLARGGVSDLTLIDQDFYEPDNQSRHTLDGTHNFRFKAEALAQRLGGANPAVKVRGFVASVPPAQRHGGRAREDRELLAAVEEAMVKSELVVDCSADDDALAYLDATVRRMGSRLVSMFISAHAEVLTILVAGKHTSPLRVRDLLVAHLRSMDSPPIELTRYLSPEDGTDAPAGVLPGAGCWHPTFPADGRHVWMLASAATDVLMDEVAQPRRSRGRAMLLKRGATAGSIEIAFNKEFR
jgi:hypothetical protein